MRNWTVGELGTISSSVSIVLSYLAEHPDLKQSLANDTAALSDAIDEILRMDAPLMSNRRITTGEVEIGGRRIPAGEKITILWASANRDEQVFGDPGTFCLQKNRDQNLLYGAGVHVCPGAPLARMELRVLMEEFLCAVDTLEPAPGDQPERAVFPTGGLRRTVDTPMRSISGISRIRSYREPDKVEIPLIRNSSCDSRERNSMPSGCSIHRNSQLSLGRL